MSVSSGRKQREGGKVGATVCRLVKAKESVLAVAASVAVGMGETAERGRGRRGKDGGAGANETHSQRLNV